MEGVVKEEQEKNYLPLNIPLAGKTGTTNKNKDAWFVGFSPDLAIGVYVGFDNPKSLGYKQTGSSVAVPIFKDFIKKLKQIQTKFLLESLQVLVLLILIKILDLISNEDNSKYNGTFYCWYRTI